MPAALATMRAPLLAALSGRAPVSRRCSAAALGIGTHPPRGLLPWYMSPFSSQHARGWGGRRACSSLAAVGPAPFSTDGEPALILGIETSCDDTGAAVVSSDGRVLGDALASQLEIHAPWGGVVPKLAMRAHADNIDRVVDEALRAAGVAPSELTAVAVTVGPGLSLCLRVGVLKARQIAAAAQVPLVPVHHMEAHALVARLAAGAGGVEFPFVALLVSGGHNLLLLVRGVGSYTLLGTTIDDAVGEAYDKTARLLGLDLSRGGGPALEAAALEGDDKRFRFSVPMRQERNKTCDFSYAGLKTATRMCIERELGLVEEVAGEVAPRALEGEELQAQRDIAAGFQTVAVKHLEERTSRAVGWALEEEPAIRSLVVAGGVACNKVVRARLEAVAQTHGLALVCPPPGLCTDNGVMVAWTGVERFALGLSEPPPAAVEGEDAHVDLRPRWPLGEKDARAIQKARGLKAARQHTNLTELTEADLDALGRD